jgi:D-beta-D-heptose 7-phosphate kinase / D-beta-D-heptose 1-phosphate adenosyltransferase
LYERLIRRLRPVPILVIGDVMVDEYVIGDVERISPESPVPVLVARDRLRRLGGAGNVVKNLVTMGGRVALSAAVGKDNPGRWFRKYCEEMAVESFWLKDDIIRPTTIKTRVVARNQQIVRIDEELVLDLSPEMERAVIEDIQAVMPQMKAVIVSDYGKGFLTSGVLKALLQSAKKDRIPVLVDPKGMDFSKYAGCAYITPNAKEASLATGIEIRDRETMVRAGRLLLEQTGAQGIVITRGKDGSTLVTREDRQDFPVKPVEIVDVTGAGDTVISTLALAIANGLSIQHAISLANLAASIVVTRFGAASVTLDEMLDSLNEDSVGSKFVSIHELSAVLKNHRLQGHTICFTNGCFDLFHSGHLEILRQASTLGDVLVVGINSDQSVERIKGPGRPVTSQSDRAATVSALGFVDYAVIFDEDTPMRLIEEVRPDVLVKGADWQGKPVAGEDIVKARGGKVAFVKLVDGVSTTALINKIRNGNPESVR